MGTSWVKIQLYLATHAHKVKKAAEIFKIHSEDTSVE